MPASTPPDQPPNASPPSGTTCVELPVTLQSGSFSSPDPGATHVASEWEVRRPDGSPDFASYNDTVNLESITIPAGTLEYYATYLWHVRHQDSSGQWSLWSAETSFRTADTPTGASVSPLWVTGNPADVDIDFTNVTGDGCTTVQILTSRPPGTGALPSRVVRMSAFYEIETTAVYVTGGAAGVDIQIPYPQPPASVDESTLKLYHWQNSSWTEEVSSVADTVNNVVSAHVTDLSPFFVGRVLPAGSGGAASIPLFPNWYTSMLAAVAAGGAGYFVWRRRMAPQQS